MPRPGIPAGHEALLRAAREEFAERGFSGTSIRQIAQAAGMSLSVLYHYYPGKQELLHALVTESIDAYFEIVGAELAKAGSDPVARLTALVRGNVIFRASHPESSSLVQSEARSLAPDFRDYYVARLAEGGRLVAAAIEDGIAAGLFRTPVPDDARRAVVSMCTNIATWYDRDGPDSVDDISARYARLALVVVEYAGN